MINNSPMEWRDQYSQPFLKTYIIETVKFSIMKKMLSPTFFFWMCQCFEITHIGKKKKKQGVRLISFSSRVLGLKHEGRKQYAEAKVYLQERENP